MPHALSQRATIGAVAAVAALTLSAPALAVDRFVAMCGSDAWAGVNVNCIAPLGPKRTIQAAINVSASGDTVYVLPGTYLENIDLQGKAITLLATGGAASTHIVAADDDPVVLCNSLEGPNTVIDGFTIRDGDVEGYGGGLFCALSSPTIVDCTFASNDAGVGGGAVYTIQASPTFSGCTFSGNRAAPGGDNGRGGAVFVETGSPDFHDCLFVDNSSSWRGGAVETGIGTSVDFDGCTFEGNHAIGPGMQAEGGAVHCNQSTLSFDATTFEGNTSTNDGAAINMFAGSLTCVGCDFIANESTASSAGGIRGYSTTVHLLGCEFTGNRSWFYGAAVTMVASDLVVTLCGFHDNGAIGSGDTKRGGAIWASYSDISVGLSTFNGNVAEEDGGAITIGGPWLGHDTEIVACTFSGNSASEKGGALSIGNGSAVISGCTFTGNESWFGGGVHVETWANDPDPTGASTSIDGCTFTGCEAFGGGGVHLWSSASITETLFEGNVALNVGGGLSVGISGTYDVRDCMFDGNSAVGGAGASSGGDACTFLRCTFSNNTAASGGALIATITGTTPRVISSTFDHNSSIEGSGAIGVGSSAGLVLVNSVVAWNDTAPGDAAIAVYSGTIDIVNCTVANNNGGGVLADEYAASVTVSNSILWGNTSGDEATGEALTVRYSNVQGGAPGIGNIDVNPKFIGALGGNYRLQPSSPCIDAGMNWIVPTDITDLDEDGLVGELVPFDFDGNPRIADSAANADSGCGLAAIIDIGPFEAPGAPSQDILLGDLDGDGLVGGSDLAILLGAWADTGACVLADVTGDGTVDGADLAVMLGAWGGGGLR